MLAQHYLGNEIDDVFSGEPTKDPQRLQRYCAQAKEALNTGYFSCFAHPDFLNFTGENEMYEKYIRDLCIHAKALEIPLEINFLGIWEKRHYPNVKFWKIAGEVGNTVIFGADAHQPEKVWNPEALDVAEKMVAEHRLKLADTIDVYKRQK